MKSYLTQITILQSVIWPTSTRESCESICAIGERIDCIARCDVDTIIRIWRIVVAGDQRSSSH